MSIGMFGDLFDDVIFANPDAISELRQTENIEILAKSIKENACYLPVRDIINHKLFDLDHWSNIASFYRIKTPITLVEVRVFSLLIATLPIKVLNLSGLLHSSVIDDFLGFYGQLPLRCLKAMVNSGLIYIQNGEVILAQGLNCNLSQSLKDELSKISVPVRVPTIQTVVDNHLSLANKPRRKSAFIRGSYEGPRVQPDEGMSQLEASIRNDLRVHIEPIGFYGDPVVAELFYTYFPSRERHKLGVIKLSKKRLYFASVEWEHVNPKDLRLRLLYELSEWGLVPNEMIKDCNLPYSGNCKFSSLAMMDLLRLEIKLGDNPTIPYSVLSDNRPKRQAERLPYQPTRDIQKFIPIGKQHERELQQLRSRVIASEKALKTVSKDRDKLARDREALLTNNPTKHPKVKSKTGKVIDLTGVIK